MNLYDSIHCEYPLPNPEAQDILFQTKNLWRNFDKYTLTEEGRLVLPCTRTEKGQRIHYADMDTFYHGILEFYGETLPYPGDVVILEAQFWEGQLTSVEEVPVTQNWYENI